MKTKAILRNQLDLFKRDKKAVLIEDAVSLLFQQYPQNTKLEEILLKVSVLNQLYSTNIFAVDIVAEHILKLNVDDKLKSGKLNLPELIARVDVSGKQKNFYSFATKYCSWHNQGAFPIYDSYVHKALNHFKKRDKFHVYKNDDLKTYSCFVETIKMFQKHYDLETFSIKEIDKALWYFSKRELLSM
ncbi:hypothetical protein [Halobacteriovorax marinus]|uniref:hypothetical protein n=1 Tax=Halobacteriovorax marinus TaxID=97084 RepID=UPI003A9204D3